MAELLSKLTFLQLSDLHIGSSGGGDAEVLRPWAALPWFDGLLGHSYDSLAKLDALFQRLRETEDAGLIITGDITSMGAPEEFGYARKFLAYDLTPPYGNFVGLRYPAWKDLAIPGNHDHWPGRPVFGDPLPDFLRAFKTCPRITPRLTFDTGHSLRIAALDSDADVGPRGLRRIFARGAFLSQLVALDKFLPPPDVGEIRVLLIHHSILWKGITLSIGGASRSALIEFAQKKGFSMFLCGHTHLPKLSKVPLPTGAMGRVPDMIFNACCGSSARITTLPFDLTVLGQRITRPAWLPNSVLVHRLSTFEDGISWDIRTLFETCHGYEELSGVPPEMCTARLFYRVGSSYADKKG